MRGRGGCQAWIWVVGSSSHTDGEFLRLSRQLTCPTSSINGPQVSMNGSNLYIHMYSCSSNENSVQLLKREFGFPGRSLVFRTNIPYRCN